MQRPFHGLVLAALLVVPVLLSASCGAPAAAEAPHAPTKKTPAHAPEKQPDQSGAPAEVRAASPAHQDDDDPNSACPADMVLVEGEYCTDAANDQKPDAQGNTPGLGGADIDAVEHQCLKEWYAPQNKKVVCEQFAEKSVCKGKMVKKRYCMDPYTWPNKKGEMPEVMNRFHQAQLKCAAVGKRLCSESEWTLACEGPDMTPFPYGYTRDVSKCHGDEEWDGPNMTRVAERDPNELRRLYKAKPNGEPECKSEFGIYDLPGNTDEIVASETFSGPRAKFDSVHSGGPWYKGVRNQCRPKIYTHDEGFYYYFLGFRCCAEADGAATNPLTPHQQKEGWDMKRVERQAGISLADMKVMLEKKKTDPTCGCTNTKCRTFCGTLMSDEAVKASQKKK